MHELKFPLSSTPGRVTGEGDGRLINAYVEKSGDQIYIRRSPGLTAVVDNGFSNPRGFFKANDGSIYGVYNGGVTRASIALGGVAIPGGGGVSIAQNNNIALMQLVAVREGGGAYTMTGTNVASYTAGEVDCPADANSVTFGDGYFFLSRPNGQIWASGLNTYDIDPLSFATAESRGDELKRVVWFGGVLYAMGTTTIEPWLNAGTSPFPLSRGTSVIPCGLITNQAVAGFEEGWDHPLFFVAHDGTVRALTGYRTKVVSTPAVEKFIQDSNDGTFAAFVYTFRGNPMWVLSSSIGTWEYNAATGGWNERVSAGQANWRAKYSAKSSHGDWRVGDALSTNFLRIDEGVFTESGATLTFTAESAPFKGFPTNVIIEGVFFDFTAASATATISWSKDGGATWSTPVTRTLTAAAKWPVRVNRLGLSSQHGLRLRVVVSDAVAFSLMGATIAGPEMRGAKVDVEKTA